MSAAGPHLPWRALAVGAVALIFACLIGWALGSVAVPPQAVLAILISKLPVVELSAGGTPEKWDTIIWQIRAPRVLLAALVGAALGISGATYQGLFRNPLADPYLIGVASGSGLGATVVLTTGIPLKLGGLTLVPLAAFVGGLAAAATAYLVARRSGGLQLTTLILAGVATASLASSVTSLMMIRSDPDVRPLLSWLMGSFGGTRWQDIGSVAPYIAIGVIGMLAYGRVLTMFQVEETEARLLGVNVERAKLVLIVLASLTTAAAVSAGGLIGFVGLVAPHSVRLIWGHDYRFLLAMSMLVGGSFLVLSDLIARTVLAPGELPVGVITAFCGAPFFIYLLQRGRKALP